MPVKKNAGKTNGGPLAGFLTGAIVPDELDVLEDDSAEGEQPLWEEPRTYFRGSDAGETCIRAMCFKCLGHRVPATARLLRIFETGRAIESAIRTRWRRAGVLVAEEQTVRTDDPPMVGHYDALVELRRRKMIGEIKSIEEGGFDRLPAKNASPAINLKNLLAVWPRYVKQLMFYLGATSLRDGFLRFEAKNSQRRATYPIPFDPALFDGIRALHRLALPYVLKQELAPVPADRKPNGAGDKKCASCYAQYLCRRLDPGVVPLAVVREVDKGLRGERVQ
jgi:hypothetical protein